ncbi:Metallo-dependent phosphatase-like protein [Ampelomyces quisqualis]|uniref:Metallo-dependent phosphatase-like protein n=1 Tax=Ampelomyces quisqualis TaxID=50730 RepID=A0A6A5R5Y5_AMPQU|nr:Metallo-dependent phosphatase-like protein [Ampelomyces quisqualis]
MAFFAPYLQIVSDLHLETPITSPQYAKFKLHVSGTALFLLGDIGLVKDDGLFDYLRRLLDQNRGCRVFYVLGNHEAYQMTLKEAVEKLRAFEEEMKQESGGRFHVLSRNRFDLNENLTILGCTLWSNIQPHQASEIYKRLTDFNEERGIREWTPERYVSEHTRDLAWLNAEVQHIETHEPHRSIMIATHHCPTEDPRATAPEHKFSAMSSAFVSDLSREPCWQSPAVKLWAFGHTHYSCTFQDETSGKLIISNQKGYSGMAMGGQSAQKMNTKIVETSGAEWSVQGTFQKSMPKETPRNKTRPTEMPPVSGAQGLSARQKVKPSLLQRITKRVQTLLRLVPRPTE